MRIYIYIVSGSKLNTTHLRQVFETLKESFNFSKTNTDKKLDQIIYDSCVQRFKYTLEISWKLMKKYLQVVRGKTDIELSVNNIFRLMEGYDFIKSHLAWRSYYEARNNTSHEYDLGKSQEIIKILPKFIEDVEILLEKLDMELE